MSERLRRLDDRALGSPRPTPPWTRTRVWTVIGIFTIWLAVGLVLALRGDSWVSLLTLPLMLVIYRVRLGPGWWRPHGEGQPEATKARHPTS